MIDYQQKQVHTRHLRTFQQKEGDTSVQFYIAQIPDLTVRANIIKFPEENWGEGFLNLNYGKRY